MSLLVRQAEFDTDITPSTTRKRKRTIDGLSDSQTQTQHNFDEDGSDEEQSKEVKARHILKISAELLMDFA